MAGTNQQLQQQITRLEMGAERLKADLARESTTKETEIDEIRGQYQRRVGFRALLGDGRPFTASWLSAENAGGSTGRSSRHEFIVGEGESGVGSESEAVRHEHAKV